MLESAEKTQAEMERKEKEASRLLQGRKSQRKVRIHTPGELQRGFGGSMGGGTMGPPRRSAISTVLNRPLSNPTAGPPPPSAADYVPPSAFLQNMEQPQNTVVQPKSNLDYFR